MKRVILTSVSGLSLRHAGRADLVVPFIYRFVWGPLPNSAHLERYLRAPWSAADPGSYWFDFVGRPSWTGLAHRSYALVPFCERFGVDVIELWFDPGPNDQLQLIWILDYLRSASALAGRLRLRLVDFDLLESDGAELRNRTVRAVDVGDSEAEAASLAWEAYHASTPELCFGLLRRKSLGSLLFLKPALEELLTELPSMTTGLGATETQLLELIGAGCKRTKELFLLRKPNGMRVFDQPELETLLEGLAFGPMPAIAGLDVELATLDPGNARGRNAAYRRSRLSLTEFGKAVLEGREDFRRHNPIRRWWGGTLLTNERLWRWDAERRSLIAPA